MAPPTRWPLPSARLQLTPSLFSQLRVKFHKLIFSNHKKTHTRPFYETDCWRTVLSRQIKQIEFQSTKRFNFHVNISLYILIHCFVLDQNMILVMTADVKLWCRWCYSNPLDSHSITSPFVNYLRLRHNLLTFTFRLLLSLYDDKKCESFLQAG